MLFLGKVLKPFVYGMLLFVLQINLAQTSELDNIALSGEKEYMKNCALCHGEKAKGDGPYSIALVFKPTDLTQLLAENNGYFPFVELYYIIDGRDMMKVHGTRLMPIWGDRYSNESWSIVNPENTQTLVRGRIFELLMYLYSIQEQ